MLAKKNRLTGQKNFAQTVKLGRGINDPLFLIKALPNNLKNSRFGIVVSNKVSKKATLRNRLKRQLRSLIFLNLSRFEKPLDVVIITRPEIKDKKYSEIKEKIFLALEKLSKKNYQ